LKREAGEGAPEEEGEEEPGVPVMRLEREEIVSTEKGAGERAVEASGTGDGVVVRAGEAREGGQVEDEEAAGFEDTGYLDHGGGWIDVLMVEDIEAEDGVEGSGWEREQVEGGLLD
jgi:hypothetical protein